MKRLILTTTLILATGTAFAGPFGILPDHEPNGFRDTTCDTASRVEVRNAAGTLLYVNNPTCPNGQGGMDPAPVSDDEDDEFEGWDVASK